MANYNKVILLGNLTRDPQLSYLPSQTPVVEIGLAVNRTWKDKDGSKKEETCFVDCKAFGKQAEIMNQYLSKGRPVLIEGRLNYSAWEDKDGNKRSKLRVIVESFQFVGGGQGQGGQPRQQQVSAGDRVPPPDMPSDEPVYEDLGSGGGDEIPF